MKTIKVGFFLLLLFAGMAIVPLVSAEKVGSLPSHNSDEFMEWANTMSGKEVTAAQCIEKNDKRYWSSLSEEKQNEFKKIKVVLPDFKKFEQPSTEQTHVQYAVGSQSAQADTPMSAMSFIYTVSHGNSIGVIPYGISYAANTYCFLNGIPCPFPDINIIADLMKYNGSGWGRVDGGTATRYGSSTVEVWKQKWYPQAGSYQIFSQHYGTFPSGSTPPVYYYAKWGNRVNYY